MIRVFQRTRHGVYRWFDRETGYPIKGPSDQDVRRDSIGRPLDDEGKHVPYDSVYTEPVHRAEIVPKTREHFYDTRGQSRWRWKETGTYAPKPGMQDIRYDKSGRPMDDTGRRIPRKSFKTDLLEPAPETKAKKTVLAEELPTKSYLKDPDFRQPKWTTQTAPELESNIYNNFSHANRSNGFDMDIVFLNAFSGHANASGMEPSDIDIYKYGAQIKLDRRLTPDERQYIREYAGRFEGVRVRWIREEQTDTFQIVFGSDTDPVLVRDVFMDLKWRKQVLEGLLDWLDEEGDYYDWYAFFDTTIADLSPKTKAS